MSEPHNIKTFTAADIEKYHKGLMSPKERHALEKAALDDPFLADALEGYGASAVNVQEDIADLKKRLKNRSEETKAVPVLPGKASSFSWWKVAAMIVLVAGAGLLVYQFGFNKKSANMAVVQKENDSVSATVNPSVDANAASGTITDKQAANKANEESGKKNNTKKLEVLPVETTATAAAAADLVNTDNANKPTASNIEPVSAAPATKKEEPLAKNVVPQQKNEALKESEFKDKVSRLDTNADGVNDLALKAPAANRQANARFKSQNEGLTINKTNVFRGRVTDNSNNPLPFSNITNTEDNVGTYSDARGYFILTSPDSVLNVQIRSLGFETDNVQLNNKILENKISLEEDKTLSAKVLDTVKRNTNRSRYSTMTLDEPEPVDGWSNYDIYLVNNLKVPESFFTKQKGGEVELSFDVDKNGEPVNITVKKSLCESCDKEAIRLLKEGPKWKRKVKKGKGSVTIAF